MEANGGGCGAFVSSLVLYVYFAYCLMVIADKTKTEGSWMAWIPILNIYLVLNIAGKPWWWLLLMLIPIVNVVLFVIAMMAVAERRNKPAWWGILVIIPVVNLALPAMLAFMD